MSVKVAGCWELGWSAPITEIDLWLHLRDFGVDGLCMSPVSGIASNAVSEFADTQAIIDAHPELTLVYVDEDGETGLADFIHPKDCLYVFGKGSFSPWKSAGKPKGCSVRIETPSSSGLLWPHQAAAIVLYDRAASR